MQKGAFILVFLISFCLKLQAQSNLSYYIEKAKENSTLIFDNKNKIVINQLEAEKLKAIYTKPQIGLSASYLFAPIISKDNNTRLEVNPDNATNYYGYDLAASNGGTYQGLINYSQPLFNNSRYEAYANQAKVNKQVNENTIKLTEHDIEKLVTDQYLLCLLDKNQMLFADSMLQILREQTSVVVKLVENSLMKQSDLTLLKIEYQNNLGLSATYKATYKRDLMALKILCGLNDTAYVLLKEVELSPNIVREKTSSNYCEKFKLDSLTILSTQKVFETKYKPQLNFYSNAGLNAVYAPSILNRFGISAGFNLTWNLFDGNQKSITHEKTDLQLQSVTFYKKNFLQQNTVRKTKILAELNSYKDRKFIAENQLREYSSLISSYREEVIQGQLSILDYITTLKNMTNAKRDYFILETNRLLLINAYNYWNW